MVETGNRKLNGLEKKVANMESKLDEITNLLKNNNKDQSKKPVYMNPRGTNVWHDKEKLARVKATPNQC